MGQVALNIYKNRLGPEGTNCIPVISSKCYFGTLSNDHNCSYNRPPAIDTQTESAGAGTMVQPSTQHRQQPLHSLFAGLTIDTNANKSSVSTHRTAAARAFTRQIQLLACWPKLGRAYGGPGLFGHSDKLHTIRGTLFWGPYNQDPTIGVLY